MPINSCHPLYTHATPQWERARTVAAGSDAVKAAGTKFLPRPAGMSPMGGDYAAYLTRASFFNATARTIAGLCGNIFQKAPTVTVPDQIAEIVKDITLTGVSAELLAMMTIREVLTVGRAGVLVDMAAVPSPGPRPYVVLYRAEDVISWRTERRDGDEILARVILRETVEESDSKDEFLIVTAERYRELALSADGVYSVRLFVKLPADHLRNPSEERWVATDAVTPLRRGQPLGFIPFTFLNATSITSAIDRPPLIDLVDLNISHYRSSAELENLLHYVASPTPWVSGFSGAQGTLKIGSSVAWVLGDPNARAGMLEMTGSGAAAIRENLEAKEKQMAVLGARLLEGQARAAETATVVQMRSSGEHANLRTIAQVAETGLSLALSWIAWWTGIEARPSETGARIELNKDFFALKMTAEELKALVLTWQSSGMSWETLHHNLTRGDLMRPGVSADEERRAIAVGAARAERMDDDGQQQADEDEEDDDAA